MATGHVLTWLCRLTIALAVVATAGFGAAEAGWLSRLARTAEHDAGRAMRHAGTLEGAAARMRAIPQKPGTIALAAHATPEGDWTFVNKAGETFTAAGPEEMKRVLSVLAPEAAARADSGLSLFLTEESVFARRAEIRFLPAQAELNVVVEQQAYPLLRRGGAGAEKLYVAVRPGVVVEVAGRALFDETVWQLARPINRANVRALALEPGGPRTLPGSPRFLADGSRRGAERLDPFALPAALSGLRGQTVLVTGRVDGNLLFVKPSSGPEVSIAIADLSKAAEAADANLVLIHSASGRQPDTRTWLWQKVEVKGLSAALDRVTMADFFDALASENGRLAVTASPGAIRTRLEARRLEEAAAAPPGSGMVSAVTEFVSDLAGKVGAEAVRIDATSRDRQQELDDRLVPFIPAAWQWGYIALALLGLFGLPVASGWFARIWPPETREDYGFATGYWAARAVRGLALVLLFAPVVAVVSAPMQAVRKMLEFAHNAWLILTWPVRRLTGARPT